MRNLSFITLFLSLPSLIQLIKLFNTFNPSPLHLTPNDSAYIQNLSRVNATDHQNIATRRPQTQDITDLTAEDITIDRTKSAEMSFSSQFSMGVWVKIPLDSLFQNSMKFMEIYFSEEGDRIALSLDNMSTSSATQVNVDSLELVRLEVPHGTWCYISTDFSIIGTSKILKVFMNDVLKLTISEERFKKTLYDMRNVIFSLGTDDFLAPYVSG
jgi:hypothetical protein